MIEDVCTKREPDQWWGHWEEWTQRDTEQVNDWTWTRRRVYKGGPIRRGITYAMFVIHYQTIMRPYGLINRYRNRLL